MRWKPPPSPWMKINLDVAIRDNVSIEATVVRDDDQGVVMAVQSKWFSSADRCDLVQRWNAKEEMPWSIAPIIEQAPARAFACDVYDVIDIFADPTSVCIDYQSWM
ncbi:hypothetical protein TorRG33x02_132980 [Trema orientale]|uniref:Uncharacterized protein n=1 Tax=Trema orientale TaxID=63057 RepID=A0A2P5EZD0_TREOI|nr:hypothetical protein TorRG33x02_132980 [Trema orientale]